MAAMVHETHALQALLRTHFYARAKGVAQPIQAVDAKEVFNEVARVTMDILYGILHEWGDRHNVLRCFPPEILAHCFTFLPLRDRITVARVSHAWRSISLAHPAIWTDLTFSNEYPIRAGLLQTALSRTGRLPIHIRSQDYYVSDEEGAVPSCMAKHMHHVRSINWLTMSSLPVNVPAPDLESFIGRDRCLLSPDFLGGVPGRLHTLKLNSPWFPAVCPAISTVTHLTLEASDAEAKSATLSGLFELFPAMQFLSISRMQARFSRFLPKTPAPSSLRRLELETIGHEYDLTAHYVDWWTPQLRDVSLNQACLPAHLVRLFEGTEELTIDGGYDGGWEAYSYDIVALGPGERKSTIHFVDKVTGGLGLHPTVLTALCSLASVRALDFPGSLADTLLSAVVTLPGLARVTLRIVTGYIGWPTIPQLKWEPLSPLASAVGERAAPLREMVVRVGADWEPWRPPPGAQDARDALQQLAALSACNLPDVRVEGFTAIALQGLDASSFDFERFSVEFPAVREDSDP